MVPRTILKQLGRLRRRERALALLWGTVRGLGVALVVLALACLLDWLIDRRQDTPPGVRWAMFVMQGALWGFLLLAFVLRPLFRRMSDGMLSLWIEQHLPALGHRLISAVQLNRRGALVDGMSSELIATVTREAENMTADLSFARIADHRRLKWSAVLAAPLLIGVASVLICWPATVEALLARQFLAERDIPRSVYVESLSPELIWPSGEEVALRFRAHGYSLPSDVYGEVRIDLPGQPSQLYPLVAEGIASTGEGTYVARVPSSVADFTYWAWLKDGRTRHPSRVHFEARPAIVEQRAWVLLPRYYGLRPNGERFAQEQARGDIVAVPNSSARIAFKTQKPVARAVLELLGAPAASLSPSTVLQEKLLQKIDVKLAEDGQSASCDLDLHADATAYRLLVEDRFGFENISPPRRLIRILPEESPQVALLPERFSASGDDGPADDFEVEGVPVPLGGSIRIAYACSAASGLSRAQLRFRVNEGPWRPLPLTEAAGSAQTGSFDPRRGAFEKSGPQDQVEFHALSTGNMDEQPGRTEGGGRFDFQTRRIPELKVGDKIEFFVEAYDRNPDPERAPGRSEARVKSVVTPAELELWVRQTLQEESRIRRLEGNQRGVFALGASVEGGDTAPARAPAEDPSPIQRPRRQAPPASTFIHTWQLLGPFPNVGDRGHDMPYPPESEPTLLTKEYEGITGSIRWRVHDSETDKIDLEKFFAHSEAGVAYAVCWVRSPDKRAALLATGSDDGIKAWLNRKLTLARRVHREAVPGEDTRRIELAQGWNEILVKVDNDFGTWAFYCELRDPNTGRALDGISYRLTPPEAIPPRAPRQVVGFVHDWQLLGPFASQASAGHTKKFPPEKDTFDPRKEYDGAKSKIRWRLHHENANYIDLAKFFNYKQEGVAYAVCWVRADAKQTVTLSIGSDDGIKIWINRKPAFDHQINRAAAPAQDKMRASLAPGWNEILVKVDNGSNEWGFYLELRDPNTERPLSGVELRATPP